MHSSAYKTELPPPPKKIIYTVQCQLHWHWTAQLGMLPPSWDQKCTSQEKRRMRWVAFWASTQELAGRAVLIVSSEQELTFIKEPSARTTYGISSVYLEWPKTATILKWWAPCQSSKIWLQGRSGSKSSFQEAEYFSFIIFHHFPSFLSSFHHFRTQNKLIMTNMQFCFSLNCAYFFFGHNAKTAIGQAGHNPNYNP